MQFDGDYNFIESLLRRFADIWIGILHQHSNNRRVAKCFVYLLILIFDLLPISGSPDWAAKVKVDGNYVIKSPIYGWALEQTQQPVKLMLKHIADELCVNAVRTFVVGNEDFEGWEKQYNDLYDAAEKNGLGLVLINSNEAKRDGDDSLEEMKLHAAKVNYKMPYLVDENSKLSDIILLL